LPYCVFKIYPTINVFPLKNQLSLLDPWLKLLYLFVLIRWRKKNFLFKLWFLLINVCQDWFWGNRIPVLNCNNYVSNSSTHAPYTILDIIKTLFVPTEFFFKSTNTIKKNPYHRKAPAFCSDFGGQYFADFLKRKRGHSMQ